MKKLIFAILLLAGCAAPATVGYDLTRVPIYDYARYVKEYAVVEEAENRYDAIRMAIMSLPSYGVSLSEKVREEIKHRADRFYYWKTVATIHGYFGKYDLMREAIDKGNTELEELVEFVGTIIQSGGTEA